MKVEWSVDALTDLDRFAEFLRERHPSLAKNIASEIIEKAKVLTGSTHLGRPLGGSAEYRQVVLQVANAAYVFQYRIDGDRLVMLRVFHGREARE
jgi:plasmid stabilization system protein ParE